jgi:WD40 repeat protein
MKSGCAVWRGNETNDDDGCRNRTSSGPTHLGLFPCRISLGLVMTALATLMVLLRWGWPVTDGPATFATLAIEGGVVEAMALSTDGALLASARCGEGMTIWDVAPRRRRAVLPSPSCVTGMAFSPDGTILATAHKRSAIGLWRAKSGEPVGTLECPGRRFFALAYSPDGRTLAASSHDDTVMLWDVPSARVVDTHEGARSAPAALAFSRDGRLLAFTQMGGSIVLWDVQRGRIRARLPGHSPDCTGHSGNGVLKYLENSVALAFAPTGKILAAQAAFEPCIRLWDLDERRLVSKIEVEPSIQPIVSFSSDGRRLILAGRGSVSELDMAAHHSKTLVDGLCPTHVRIALTPTGAGPLAIADGGRLTLWQPEAHADMRRATITLPRHAGPVENETDP